MFLKDDCRGGKMASNLSIIPLSAQPTAPRSNVPAVCLASWANTTQDQPHKIGGMMSNLWSPGVFLPVILGDGSFWANRTGVKKFGEEAANRLCLLLGRLGYAQDRDSKALTNLFNPWFQPRRKCFASSHQRIFTLKSPVYANQSPH
jgi:hypothetical protein